MTQPTVTLTREQLLDIATSAATIGRNFGATSLTRGDLTALVELHGVLTPVVFTETSTTIAIAVDVDAYIDEYGEVDTSPAIAIRHARRTVEYAAGRAFERIGGWARIVPGLEG